MRVYAGLILLAACGIQGPQGPKGDRGPVGGVGTAKACAKAVNGFLYEYEVATYSDQSMFVTCSVADMQHQYSNSAVYPAGSPGTKDGSCTVLFSIGTDQAGAFIFTDSPVTATYHDPGSKQDGATVSFASGDCSG